jgi:hypothetical protein
MNSTTEVRDALRDLFQFHFSPQIWLPMFLVAVAAGTLAVLILGIQYRLPAAGWVAPEFRNSLTYRAMICWAVSTFCTYAGGFVMGRLAGS